jgi:YHS domain-containing protein
MKKTMVVVAFVWCFAAGVVAWAADPTPAQPPAPDPSPHAGHQMPMQGGHDMQGGHMGGMMMNCSMHKNMGEVMVLMKDVMLVQNAILKGVSGAEKDAMQAKLATMLTTLDNLQAQPMSCPMMQQMHHGQHPTAAPAARGADGSTSTGETKDPICGMAVDPVQAKTAGLTIDYQGKTYYFCSDACKQQFAKDPTRYTAARP